VNSEYLKGGSVAGGDKQAAREPTAADARQVLEHRPLDVPPSHRSIPEREPDNRVSTVRPRRARGRTRACRDLYRSYDINPRAARISRRQPPRADRPRRPVAREKPPKLYLLGRPSLVGGDVANA